MSYTREVKNELSKIKLDQTNLILAELMAYVRLGASIKMSQGGIALEFSTENASVARRVFTFLKTYSEDIESTVRRSKNLQKRTYYEFVLEDEYAIRDLLYDTGFITGTNIFDRNYEINDELLSTTEMKRAYIRGAFLFGGYMSDPERAYHMEIQTGDEILAQDINKHLKSLNIDGNISSRRGRYFLYIKNAQSIGELLINMGANQIYFQYEDIRVLKDMRNNINRVVNFETANLDKTIAASMEQVIDINYLIEIGEFDYLKEDIKEVALLRLENQDSSLQQISDLSGKYSRTAVNYRLNKIKDMAKKLRGE